MQGSLPKGRDMGAVIGLRFGTIRPILRRGRAQLVAGTAAFALLAVLLPAGSAFASPPEFPGGYLYPTDTTSVSAGWLLQGDGCPSPSGYVSGYFHLGVDFPRPAGSAVYAIDDGTALPHSNDWDREGNKGVGIVHTDADGARFVALYGHIRSNLSAGDTVRRGQQIGTIGPFSGGSHLHFGVHPGTSLPSSGQGMLPCSQWGSTNGFVDPLAYLRDRRPSGGSGQSSCEDLTADRSLVRERGQDAVYVLAGGAAFHFRSRDNLETAGYSMDAVCEVEPGWVEQRRRFPGDGTHLQPHDGPGVRTVAGRALFGWTSADAFRAADHDFGRVIRVDAVHIGSSGRFRSLPTDGTHLQPHDGPGVRTVAGGALFGWTSADAFREAGHDFDRVVRVQGHHLGTEGRFASMPTDGTHLQPHDGPGVRTVAGGALFGWTSADDFRAAGYDFNQVVRVQSHHIGDDGRFGSIPRDGTILTELGSGISWLVEGGYRQITESTGTIVDGRHLTGIPQHEEGAAGRFPFIDVDPESAHADAIELLASSQVARGCSADRFCPSDPVTRAQMASFLTRALGYNVPEASPGFDDVVEGDVHAGAIAALAVEGVTDGCAPDRFCPSDPVTRAQMASFLVRATTSPEMSREAP